MHKLPLRQFVLVFQKVLVVTALFLKLRAAIFLAYFPYFGIKIKVGL
jgi:hypothetical protein